MATEVTVWQADDGTRFATEAEAVRHEAMIIEAARVGDFVKSTGRQGRAFSRTQNEIVKWLEWSRDNPPPVRVG